MKTRASACCLVEQNASMALSLASEVYLLETGRIVLNGPASLISGDLARAYLELHGMRRRDSGRTSSGEGREH